MPQPAAASAIATRTARDTQLGLLGAAIAVTTWGASGVIVKAIDMGGIAIAAWRFAAYFVIIGIWRYATGSRLTRAAIRASLLGGFALSVDVIFFFSAVKLTTIVNATIIGALQPIVVTAYAVGFLGEKVKARQLVLALVAIAGVVVIVLSGASTDADGTESSTLGNLCALGALLAWSCYFVIAKRVDGKVSPGDYTLAVAAMVALVCFPVAVVFGQSIAWPSANNWLWLLIMALGAGILGHNMMNWSLPRIPLWIGSTMTLLTPIVSALAAWWFLGESFTLTQLAAMLVVLGALAVIVLDQTRAGAENDESAAPGGGASSQ